MKNTVTTSAQDANKQEESPDLVKRIDRTTYHVKAHFCKTGRETMKDKIIRMLRNEVNALKL